MVDAVEMREHGHARLLLHARDEALAAARDDDVDQPLRAEHRADRGAVLRRPELHRVGGETRRDEPRRERTVKSAGRIHRFAASPPPHLLARTPPAPRPIAADKNTTAAGR